VAAPRGRTIVIVGVLAAAGVAFGVVRALDQDAGDEAAPPPTTSADVTPATATQATATVPYFRAAPGWEAVQEGAAAAAGNVPLGTDVLEVFPAGEAVGRLEEGDVVLKVFSWQGAPVEATFPPRELPLSLDDAEPGGIEGSPDDVYVERLLARVADWNMDLLIFYGGTDPTPSAETRAAAQDLLDGLVVPSDESGP
jgi:hypothetical protein